MIDLDFTYDGVSASSLRLMICQFDEGKGFETQSNAPAITFGTASRHGGMHFVRTSSTRGECAKLEFSICKIGGGYFSYDLAAQINKWLCRDDYHELVLNDGTFIRRYFGSFNTSNVLHLGKIAGMTLSFTADSPYGYGDTVTFNASAETGGSISIPNESYENLPIYPERVVLTAQTGGDIVLIGEDGTRTTVIRNCAAGEMITMDCKNYIITSSNPSHGICNDFNYIFPRISTDGDVCEFICDGVGCSAVFTYRTYFKGVI